jgi:2-amino-4-hydroxy-6-hydroxymethyldihydropteridine diphosphokinase
MSIVYLALGSNVGDSKQHIAEAIKQMNPMISSIQQAKLYVTKPVGYTDQADFVNTAVRGETSLSPHELLKFLKNIEKQVGRVERFRWGPREIDIDIIFYGDEVINRKGLIIPHPRFSERDFVLKPLQDIDPDKHDPVSGKTVQELLQALPDDQLSVR